MSTRIEDLPDNYFEDIDEEEVEDAVKEEIVIKKEPPKLIEKFEEPKKWSIISEINIQNIVLFFLATLITLPMVDSLLFMLPLNDFYKALLKSGILIVVYRLIVINLVNK